MMFLADPNESVGGTENPVGTASTATMDEQHRQASETDVKVKW